MKSMETLWDEYNKFEDSVETRLVECITLSHAHDFPPPQRYTYRVLQTIQMKLILLCVWAEAAVLGSTKTALKFKYEI